MRYRLTYERSFSKSLDQLWLDGDTTRALSLPQDYSIEHDSPRDDVGGFNLREVHSISAALRSRVSAGQVRDNLAGEDVT
jgi:hypothetical protein